MRSKNLAAPSIDKETAAQCQTVATIFQSLSHPTRLKILCALLDGPQSVGFLADYCELSQANTSQFLARMKEDELIDSERNGRNVLYRVSDPKLFKLLASVRNLYCR